MTATHPRETLRAICEAMRDSEPGMENRSWLYWVPSARVALIALSENLPPMTTLIGPGPDADNAIVIGDTLYKRLVAGVLKHVAEAETFE